LCVVNIGKFEFKMLKLFILGVTLNIYLQIVTGTSPPYDPAIAKAQKLEYCETLLELQRKLPQKFQQYYDHIQTKLCSDDSVEHNDISKYLKDNLSADDYTEVHVIEVGKEKYCEYILGISEFYRTDDSPPEDSDKITTPEYLQFKENCKDSSKDITSIIPLAQKLAKIYTYFNN